MRLISFKKTKKGKAMKKIFAVLAIGTAISTFNTNSIEASTGKKIQKRETSKCQNQDCKCADCKCIDCKCK